MCLWVRACLKRTGALREESEGAPCKGSHALTHTMQGHKALDYVCLDAHVQAQILHAQQARAHTRTQKCPPDAHAHKSTHKESFP